MVYLHLYSIITIVVGNIIGWWYYWGKRQWPLPLPTSHSTAFYLSTFWAWHKLCTVSPFIVIFSREHSKLSTALNKPICYLTSVKRIWQCFFFGRRHQASSIFRIYVYNLVNIMYAILWAERWLTCSLLMVCWDLALRKQLRRTKLALGIFYTIWFFYATLPSPWAAAIFSSCMFGSSMPLYLVLELLQSSAAACLVLLCHFTKSLSCSNLQQLHVWFFYVTLPSPWAAAIFSSCMFGSSMSLYLVLELLQSSAAACLVLLCHYT